MEPSTLVPKEDTIKALGPLSTVSDRFFYGEMMKLFTPMYKPSPGDWLHSHKEKTQLLSDYKPPHMNFVTPEKKTIYILPFGKFDDKFMKTLMDFCKIFYPGTLVSTLPSKDLKKEIPNITFRQNSYGDQFLCADILGYMKKHVPADAYCVMGITLEDIYPGPNWNFVYGWATYNVRVGIFSFIRWDEDYAEGKTKTIDWDLIAYPSLRTMVHEIGHMFGVLHCVFYNCLMNGYNNIQENYTHPFEFCPVCFRKLHHNLKFNKKARYAALLEYCEKSNIKQLKGDIQLYRKLLALSSDPKAGEANTSQPQPNTQVQAQKTQVTQVTRPSRSVAKPPVKAIQGKNVRLGSVDPRKKR